MISEETFRIRPEGRHLLTIGRDLITDRYAALVELVKNAYDADSEIVTIDFISNKKRDELKIVISDSGHGMSREDIITKWLVPSTSNKKINKKSKIKKRIMQGRKGIGRYAASILGESLELVTVSNGEKSTLKIDWKEFDNALYLDQVNIKIDSVKTDEINGTSLIIVAKNEEATEWTQKECNKLEFELKRIISPVKNIDKSAEEDKFDICLFYNKYFLDQGIDKTVTIEPYPILELFDYRIFGWIKSSGECELTYINHRAKKNNVEEIGKINLREPLSCDDIYIDIRAYDREPDAIEELIQRGLKSEDGSYLGKLQARKLLDNFNGIGVYRNGFRIRPLGDANFDWLKLNEKRIQQPSLRLGINQVIGHVVIKSEEYSNLEENSARDGLKKNKSYEDLLDAVSKSINLLESRRFKYRRAVGITKSSRDIDKKIESLFNLDDLQGDIGKVLDKEKISDETRKNLDNIISNKIAESNKLADELKKIVAIYQGQATLGKIINILLHEGRRPLNYFENGVENLRFWVDKHIETPTDDSRVEINEIGEGILRNSKELVHLFKRVDPLATSSRSKKKKFKVLKSVRESVDVFSEILEKQNIEVTINIDKDIEINGWVQDFRTIFYNLIENSIHWIKTRNEKGEVVFEASVVNNKTRIDIMDTGPGVEGKFLENQDIFEPEFSTKEGGQGLGLAIAGEAAKRNGFELFAIETQNGAHFVLEARGEKSD